MIDIRSHPQYIHAITLTHQHTYKANQSTNNHITINKCYIKMRGALHFLHQKLRRTTPNKLRGGPRSRSVYIPKRKSRSKRTWTIYICIQYREECRLSCRCRGKYVWIRTRCVACGQGAAREMKNRPIATANRLGLFGCWCWSVV